MKKYVKYISILIFAVLLLYSNKANASSSATVFVGEPIILDSYENIEITYNNVEINEETSEIKNTQLYTNLSDKVITRKASIKLEDSYSNLTINSLKILVNDLEIKEITKEEDNYIFYFQINPNEGKKIEFNYKTDSNLQDAKIIKYTMDKLKGKKVSKFDLKIKFVEEDMPLVEKIYPQCYEYDYSNNIMTTTYYNFVVNNLTSNFIVQKETYKNLIYGMGEELSDEELYIAKNARKWINDGLKFNYNNIGYDQWGRLNYGSYIYDLEKQLINKESNYWENSNTKSIKSYIIYKQLCNDNKIDYLNSLIDKKSIEEFGTSEFMMSFDRNNPLVYEYIMKNSDRIISDTQDYRICIDYVRSEGDKELYIDRSFFDEDKGKWKSIFEKKDEFSILRTKNKAWIPDRIAAREIHINEDIDGNEIYATEEEKIEYVNMINADLYIREVIYDGNTKSYEEEYGNGNKIKQLYPDGVVYGYYSETGKKILDDAGYKEDESMHLRDFRNDLVKTKAEVPTFANSIGYLGEINNKYIVAIGKGDGKTPFDYIGTIETNLAQEMIKKNRKKNKDIQDKVNYKISNLKITKDMEEFALKDEKKEENNKIENNLEIIKGLDRQDIITLSSIFGTIILLIIILIIILIKNKRRK